MGGRLTRKEATQQLFQVVDSGDHSAVTTALAAGADVMGRGSRRETPLHWAARKGNVEIARVLIEYGADVTAKDTRHHTPLDWAALYYHSDMVSLLQDAARKAGSWRHRVAEAAKAFAAPHV